MEFDLNSNRSAEFEFDRKDQHFLSGAVRLAISLKFQEPVLLVGPTSYKTRLVNFVLSLIKFSVPKPLTTLYLSILTSSAELFGGVEPHIKESYSMYVRKVLQYLDPEATELDLAKFSDRLPK